MREQVRGRTSPDAFVLIACTRSAEGMISREEVDAADGVNDNRDDSERVTFAIIRESTRKSVFVSVERASFSQNSSTRIPCLKVADLTNRYARFFSAFRVDGYLRIATLSSSRRGTRSGVSLTRRMRREPLAQVTALLKTMKQTLYERGYGANYLAISRASNK